jgi:integrase/recombinase XerC/integrase/recombinase XerD
MQNTAHLFTKNEAAISVEQLERYAEGWLLDGEIRQLSKSTLDGRRIVIDKLLWFLKQREYPVCSTMELRQFLAYISTGHENAQGRWGNPQLTRRVRPTTPVTYFSRLRTLFRFLVQEEAIVVSPMEKMRPPVARPDQIQPFDQAQVTALLSAAKRSQHPRRNEALLLLLLDTGLRASEICSLCLKDVDMSARRCTVVGKGNKTRVVYYGGTTAKALWQYLKEEIRDAEDPLFLADGGTRAGEALSRSGLLQLIKRLGKAAKIEAMRCSPHTFRHTFAVEFLRNGGNVFSLQTLLGHTSLSMSRRYTALAQADIENQHRQFSPVDRMKGKIRKK